MISDRLKAQLLVAALLLAAAFVVSVLIAGTATVAGWLLPFLQVLCGVTLAACVLVLLPMSAVVRWQARAAGGFIAASFVFGASVWLAGFFHTYDLWGVLGIAIGLLLLGIGVVPLAIIALLLDGAVDVAGLLALGVVLTFAARFYGVHVGEKAARFEYERATKTITIEPNR